NSFSLFSILVRQESQFTKTIMAAIKSTNEERKFYGGTLAAGPDTPYNPISSHGSIDLLRNQVQLDAITNTSQNYVNLNPGSSPLCHNGSFQSAIWRR
ncbi:hypothetical protein VP01_1152g1, partial [Puccinia sorghi]